MRYGRLIAIVLSASVFVVYSSQVNIHGQGTKDSTDWGNAKVAKLTLKITLEQMSKIEKGEWAKPDWKKFDEPKRRLLIAQGLARPGSNEKVKDEKAILVVMWLSREDAKTWPKKNGSFDKDSLNMKGTELFLRPGTKWLETYDLVLKGKPSPGGVIKGKVSGILGAETFATKIKDASFEMKPIRKPEDRID